MSQPDREEPIEEHMDVQPNQEEQRIPVEVNVHELFDEPNPPAPIEWQGLLPSMERRIKKIEETMSSNFGKINKKLDWCLDNQEDIIGNELDKIRRQLKSLTNAVYEEIDYGHGKPVTERIAKERTPSPQPGPIEQKWLEVAKVLIPEKTSYETDERSWNTAHTGKGAAANAQISTAPATNSHSHPTPPWQSIHYPPALRRPLRVRLR
ncbi:unnamed protein product [Cylicocyclus nassatus]|uniref:Uncharacterized protein n=1 Tax=Cylicocyclus nassatus TaxID=53992 RepID=A0AA36GT58_CYLNA|nr:unnamed protein product [Cylicocyclus nassatus]